MDAPDCVTVAMDDAERLLVQRTIACILDHPSVYMGGASHNSMRKAELIIAALERGERLFHTTCDHHGWMTYKAHGIYCPDCGSKIREPEATK